MDFRLRGNDKENGNDSAGKGNATKRGEMEF